MANPVLTLWRAAGWLLRPVLWLFLLYHCRKHRPDMKDKAGSGTFLTQYAERRGQTTSLPLWPAEADILWLHGASIGEILSAFPLIDALLEQKPELYLLVTTTTATGKQTIMRHKAYGQHLHHHYIPYDIAPWVEHFLKTWKPKGAIFIESEIWPVILWACQKRNIPFMLANARLSARSLKRWNILPKVFSDILGMMRWIAPCSQTDLHAFAAFSPPSLPYFGNLKEDAPNLPYDPAQAAEITGKIGQRPVLVAASTHEGEEDILHDNLQAAQARYPDLLGIFIPRHPARGAELSRKFRAPRRSLGQFPDRHTLIWVVDTIGETGLFYHLAGERNKTGKGQVFLGNSLLPPGGGHNPFEPLRYSCPVAVGRFTQNWSEICQDTQYGIVTVHNSAELAAWLETDHLPSPRPKRENTVSTHLAEHILATVFPARAEDNHGL